MKKIKKRKRRRIVLQERKSFKKLSNSLRKTRDSRLVHYLFKEVAYRRQRSTAMQMEHNN